MIRNNCLRPAVFLRFYDIFARGCLPQLLLHVYACAGFSIPCIKIFKLTSADRRHVKIYVANDKLQRSIALRNRDDTIEETLTHKKAGECQIVGKHIIMDL